MFLYHRFDEGIKFFHIISLKTTNRMNKEQLAEALYLENKAIKKIDCK